MKKTLTILALALTTTTSLFAQDSKTEELFKKYRFSLFAGPTFNSLRPIAGTTDTFNVSKNGGNVGFTFGINADYNLNERYTIFTGVGMDWRGGKINAQLPATAVSKDKYVRGADVNYKTQYLTIPVGIKMTAATIDKIKIQALAGFDLSLLLSQKGDITFTNNNIDSTTGKYQVVKLEKQKLGGLATVVPLNLGWSLGIGGEYDLNGKNAVIFQLIYRNGFVDVTTPKTNNDGAKFSDGNVRSNSFAVRFGYTF